MRSRRRRFRKVHQAARKATHKLFSLRQYYLVVDGPYAFVDWAYPWEPEQAPGEWGRGKSREYLESEALKHNRDSRDACRKMGQNASGCINHCCAAAAKGDLIELTRLQTLIKND